MDRPTLTLVAVFDLVPTTRHQQGRGQDRVSGRLMDGDQNAQQRFGLGHVEE
jgi:hypothetical protein